MNRSKSMLALPYHSLRPPYKLAPSMKIATRSSGINVLSFSDARNSLEPFLIEFFPGLGILAAIMSLSLHCRGRSITSGALHCSAPFVWFCRSRR